MIIDTDSNGNLVIRADGHDTQFVARPPNDLLHQQSEGLAILALRDGSLLAVWEEGGKIKTSRIKAPQ